MSLKPCILAFVAYLAAPAVAQKYIGADTALKEIAAPVSQKAQEAADPAGEFWRAVDAFRRSQPKLSVKESASQWIGLAERCPRTDAMEQLAGYASPAFAEVMAALPGPDAWPSIETLLKGRMARAPLARNMALLALFETLDGRSADASNELARMKGLGPEQAVLLTQVEVALALHDKDKDLIEQAYRREALAYSGPTQPIGGDKTMDLPDLSVILGPARARSLLMDIFRTFDGEVKIDKSAAFKKMAREAAIANVTKLKHPQWTLALDPDGAPLFEALHKQFPDVTQGTQRNAGWASDTYAGAAASYMIYLVVHGRVPDAAAFVKNLSSTYWSWQMTDEQAALIRKDGKTEDFARFLEAMIQSGSTNLLRTYVAFCNDNGFGDREKRFVAQLPPSVNHDQQSETDTRVRFLVAHNQVEQAGELLRKRLEEPNAVESISHNAPNFASNLYDIGAYLHRKQYQEFAMRIGEQALASTDSFFIQHWVYEAMIDEGRGPEAERLLADDLQKVAHTSQSSRGGKEQYEGLIRVYAAAGRWTDVLSLLEEAPGWGVTDVAFLNDVQKRQHGIPFVAAQALAGVGRKEEALHVLLFVLNAQPDLDQAYELLLSLDASDAGDVLDRLHRTSPIATRPLMWKAKLLQNGGKLADAERLVRQAIAIDPQDSSAWESETRFQPWAILAGIERAEGKTTAAALHQRKFDTVHKYYTNNGGDRWSLEIDGPANRMRGLADNPDDFNLRFAVAEDLRAGGRLDEAKKQYVKATRCMAEQLGEAGESLGWYDMPQYHEDAERAVKDVIAKNPASSSAYVTLAGIYSSDDKCDDAQETYLRALTGDSNSMAAWKGLAELEEKAELPADLIETVWLNEIRLSPNDADWSTQKRVQSYRRLWTTAEQALRDSISVPEPAFTLSVSAAEAPDPNSQGEYGRMHDWPPTAGAILNQEDVIKSLANLIGTLTTTVQEAKLHAVR